MKTRKKNTLNEFLTKVNAQRKRFGDMMVTTFKDQKGKLLIEFSRHTKAYMFQWDASSHDWIMTEV